MKIIEKYVIHILVLLAYLIVFGIAAISRNNDTVILFGWFLFPFAALIACAVAAASFSPKFSWILPVVSWFLEIIGTHHPLTPEWIFNFDAPTLWGPFIGYVLGIIIYLCRYAVRQIRAERRGTGRN